MMSGRPQQGRQRAPAARDEGHVPRAAELFEAMMISVPLIFPVEQDGRTYSVINLCRPGPIAFARYWLHRDLLPYPVGIVDVPVEVADALNKVDLDRVMAAAASVCRPYLFLIAIWQVFRPPSPEQPKG